MYVLFSIACVVTGGMLGFYLAELYLDFLSGDGNE